MRRVLFDINIVLDVLLEREGHVEASAAVWAAVESGQAEGMLSAHAVATIHYLVRKEHGESKTRQTLADILRVFGVAAVDSGVIDEALRMPMADFEDAITAAAARGAGCECVVTRDPKGFKGSPVRAMSPDAVRPLLIGVPLRRLRKSEGR